MSIHIHSRTSETGMVSIIITMIMMIIITLVVIGFAKLMRREQREVLDRQLSTQAFYAAETGVNDAIKALQAGHTEPKTTCGPSAPYTTSVIDPNLDSAVGISYTCLLINNQPSELKYDNIDPNDSKNSSRVIPVFASDVLNSIQVSWELANLPGSPGFASCPALGNFPPLNGAGAYPNNGCDAGVLKVELLPLDSTLSRNGLMANDFTIFLQPQTGGGSVTYSNSDPNKGQIIAGNCSTGATPRLCNVTINLPGDHAFYYMRVRSIYKPNAVTITPTGPSGAVTLSNAQAVIDSTGKANDVLRRIVTRVDLNQSDSGIPNFAIQTRDSICKRFTAASGIPPVVTSADPSCLLN